MSRTDTLYSLGLMPALMGLGHLAPAIGAIHTATGSYQFPSKLLGLIGTISAVVDSIDTYKDIPKTNRPSTWVWKAWVYGLWAIVLTCTVMLDLQTVYDIYRVLPLGLLWGVPCIPSYSASKGLVLSKPKTLLVEAKSLVGHRGRYQRGLADITGQAREARDDVLYDGNGTVARPDFDTQRRFHGKKYHRSVSTSYSLILADQFDNGRLLEGLEVS
ncbi:hypothetical protein FDECE_654 [Fusarium decemcellulare]|nr:hypothetical protein FDECE_654 [Fusarium decemcellulare]